MSAVKFFLKLLLVLVPIIGIPLAMGHWSTGWGLLFGIILFSFVFPILGCCSKKRDIAMGSLCFLILLTPVSVLVGVLVR